MCDEVEGVVALGIGDGGVCAVRDEKLDDIEVAVASGPLHGCGDEVAAEGIDVCTVGEEETAGRDMCVDGSPVKGCDVLRIAVCGVCGAR